MTKHGVSKREANTFLKIVKYKLFIWFIFKIEFNDANDIVNINIDRSDVNHILSRKQISWQLPTRVESRNANVLLWIIAMCLCVLILVGGIFLIVMIAQFD